MSEDKAKRVEEDVEIMDMIPATAGPVPLFYKNAEGEVEKVVLDLRSVDTGVDWHLDLTSEGNHLKARGYRMRVI